MCIRDRPGDEVLTFAPYFPEYGPYVAGTGAVLKLSLIHIFHAGLLAHGLAQFGSHDGNDEHGQRAACAAQSIGRVAYGDQACLLYTS